MKKQENYKRRRNETELHTNSFGADFIYSRESMKAVCQLKIAVLSKS